MNAQSLLMSAAYYMEDVSDPVSTLLWIGLAILVALILVVVFLRFVPLGLWITSLAAGVHVSISSLVGMRLRRIQPKRLVEPLIKARKARVTVRTNIERLVGGAGEETIIARVGEGIVTTVGSSETHKQVLENPDLISRTVLNKGLDAGTAYEILSIDIADVDVGRNVGAQLQMDQAEADRRIAQARAEERRAMAVAREQEMKASVQEMRARVVEAEAEVPKAMAAALREGKLGVMDYYQMKNVEADTNMRDSIAKVSAPPVNSEGKK